MAKVRIKGQDAGTTAGTGGLDFGASTAPAATDAPVKERLTEDVFKGETEKAEFVNFLVSEIKTVQSGSERQAWLERVKKWRRQRQAVPATEKKEYPFPDSANTSPPLVMTRLHTVYAKMMSNYSLKRPFWSGDAVNSDWSLHGETMADILNFYSKSKFHTDIQSVNRVMLYDLASLGTQFCRVSWEMDRFKGGADGAKPSYKRNSPVVTPIALEDFYMRAVWTDIQKAPWCGARMKKSYRELMDLAAQGYYDEKAVETMKTAAMREFTDAEKAEFERQGITPNLDNAVDASKFFEVYECYVYWDIDGDGQLEDVLVCIEPTTGTLLRSVRNTVGWRLFARLVYMEIPGFLYGAGICFLLEKLQDEADTLRNMRLDGIRWRMLNMTVTRKGSGNDANPTVYPGKNWNLNSLDDFKFIEVPDTSQTTLQAEAIVSRDADLAAGVNEAMGGFADSTMKSGGGAQAQQLMMEQGFSTLNVNLETVDDCYTELGRMMTLVIHSNQGLVDVSYLSQEKQAAWQEICAQPIEQLPNLFRFNIETTELARNEASMRENFLALSGLLTQYGTEMAQTYVAYQAAMAQGQTFMAELMRKLIIGKTQVLEKSVEFLHVGKPSDFVPDIKTLLGGENGQPGIDGGGGQGQGAGTPVPGSAGQPGAVPMGAFDTGAPGMGGLV